MNLRFWHVTKVVGKEPDWVWETDMDKLTDYLRVTEAAEYLGVSPNTLRNWENAGKITAHRHPVNGYRLFVQRDLDALLKQVKKPDAKSKKKRVKKPR
jgi:excisionase family DNA binding protein